MPPSGARCSCTSSMKLRIRKMPRPLDLSRFSGSSGLATCSGSKPSPWSRTRIDELRHVGRGRRLELDEHVLGRVVAVAVLDRVDDRLADRDADPVQRVLVEADAARQVIADHLHEVEHLEGAGELEPDDAGGRWCRHVCVTRHSINTISSAMSRRSVSSQGRVRFYRMPTAAATVAPARRIRGRLTRAGRQVDLASLRAARRARRRTVDADQFRSWRRLPVDARLPARASASTSTTRADGTRHSTGTRFRAAPFAGRPARRRQLRAPRCGCWPACWPGIRSRAPSIGDASLSRRPMRRVIEPLERMGARIDAADGHAAADDPRRAAARALPTSPRRRARR